MGFAVCSHLSTHTNTAMLDLDMKCATCPTAPPSGILVFPVADICVWDSLSAATSNNVTLGRTQDTVFSLSRK